MNEFLFLCLFLLDAAMVAVTAWLALCAVRGETTGKLEPLMGWGLMMLFVVSGSGVILGLTGSLSRSGFLAAHAALLVILFTLRRHRWRNDLGAAQMWLAGLRQFLAEPTGLSRAVAGLILLILGLTALSAAAQPRIHDTLAYRLPRIGLWLQEGRIFHFETIDPRLNYMPWVPDLFTAWLLGATSEGWALVASIQTLGGALLLVATIALARQAGLARWPALGAATLVFGLANVAVQFTSSQTDLFTAGILAAAFALWQGALLRGNGSVTAGLGVALALGSKGTVFYIAPGLAIVVVYLVVRYKVTWREWRRSVVGGMAGVALLAVPAYRMNVATYGGIFGSAEAVQFHHGQPGLGIAARLEKLSVNLRTSAIQLFEPNSQPAGLRELAGRAGNALLQAMPQPEKDPYAFLEYSRHYSLENVLKPSEPNPDVASCGLLAVLMFFAAVITLLIARQRIARRTLLLSGAAALVVYVGFQHAVVQWHPWGFRFMALAAPWWAVTVAAGLEAWPRRVRQGAWLLMLAASGSVFWHVTTRTPEAGWLALTQPEPPYRVHQAWRRWSDSLGPAGTPLRIALEVNNPLAAFFRHARPRPVTLLRPITEPGQTAENLLLRTDGWLVVPATQFIGREGRVRAESLIFPERADTYSLAAYRRLGPGETPPPVIYRDRRADTREQARRALLLRVWDAESVPFQLYNPRPEPCRWVVHAPARDYEGEVPAGGTAEVAVSLPANTLLELMITFHCPPGSAAPSVALGK